MVNKKNITYNLNLSFFISVRPLQKIDKVIDWFTKTFTHHIGSITGWNVCKLRGYIPTCLIATNMVF